MSESSLAETLEEVLQKVLFLGLPLLLIRLLFSDSRICCFSSFNCNSYMDTKEVDTVVILLLLSTIFALLRFLLLFFCGERHRQLFFFHENSTKGKKKNFYKAGTLLKSEILYLCNGYVLAKYRICFNSVFYYRIPKKVSNTV